MTVKEAYLTAKTAFSEAGILSSSFDALCLMQKYFGIDRVRLSTKGDSPADEPALTAFLEAVDRRKKGEPLQYILEEWTLCGIPFKVGDGVLIPRQETELLVETALEQVQDIKAPVIYDLCGGSGCISICLSKLKPDAKIYTVELSDLAYWYLYENIELHKADNVKPIKGDVLKGYLGIAYESADLIVSNPPYIKTKDIKNLSREVLREPQIALDGGADGLEFYRAIAGRWLNAMKSGGKIAVEVGAGQAGDVSKIFRAEGIYNIERRKDLSGIERVITGTVI